MDKFAVCQKLSGEMWVAHADAVKCYDKKYIRVVAKDLTYKEAKALNKLLKGVKYG
jgi:hypothetical protein